MKVKKSEKTLLPKYPSSRQFSESRALAGLAALGLTVVTGLGDQASKGEAPIRTRGRIAVVPMHSSTGTTNNPPPIQETKDVPIAKGKMPIEPRPRPPGSMPPPKPGATNHQGRITYYVKQGDTLSGLARKYLGDSDRWKEIAAINPGLTAENLKVDQIINIPPKKPNSSASRE